MTFLCISFLFVFPFFFFSFSDFCAADDDFRNQFKVPPFQDCMLSFLGFSDDEKANMEEMTEMQGYCL